MYLDKNDTGGTRGDGGSELHSHMYMPNRIQFIIHTLSIFDTFGAKILCKSAVYPVTVSFHLPVISIGTQGSLLMQQQCSTIAQCTPRLVTHQPNVYVKASRFMHEG